MGGVMELSPQFRRECEQRGYPQFVGNETGSDNRIIFGNPPREILIPRFGTMEHDFEGTRFIINEPGKIAQNIASAREKIAQSFGISLRNDETVCVEKKGEFRPLDFKVAGLGAKVHNDALAITFNFFRLFLKLMPKGIMTVGSVTEGLSLLGLSDADLIVFLAQADQDVFKTLCSEPEVLNNKFGLALQRFGSNKHVDRLFSVVHISVILARDNSKDVLGWLQDSEPNFPNIKIHFT